MANVRSAGLLLYRFSGSELPTRDALEVWIAHMGGPFWARKDDHAWSIPKGEYDLGDDPFAAALREFEEEIGVPAPDHGYAALGEFRQSSGKIVTVFCAESDFDVDAVVSNTFELEWPPRSGRLQQFPEIDDARWVPIDDARTKVAKGQIPALDALVASLGLG